MPNADEAHAAAQFAAIQAEAETNSDPIRMINLIKFRELAEYPPDLEPEDGPLTGAQAYARYGELAGPYVAASGASLVSFSATNKTVLGPSDESWDQVFTVEYPNRTAFLTMATSEDYQAVAHHRAAAVQNSRLIMTEVGSR